MAEPDTVQIGANHTGAPALSILLANSSGPAAVRNGCERKARRPAPAKVTSQETPGMSDDPPADRTRPEPAGWLGRFLGRFGLRRDPTRAWPQNDTPLPPFDLAARSLGGLRLGDPLDAAEFLGRPDAVKQTRYCLVLLYRRRGFELAF